MGSRPGDRPLGRFVRLALDRSKRLSVLIAVGYVAAVAGLAVGFVGADRPQGDVAAAGIVLLFLSFASLFYVSISIVSLGDG